MKSYPKYHEHDEEACKHCEIYNEIRLDQVADQVTIDQFNFQLQLISDKNRELKQTTPTHPYLQK